MIMKKNYYYFYYYYSCHICSNHSLTITKSLAFTIFADRLDVEEGHDVVNIAWPFAAVETMSELMDCRLDSCKEIV